VNSVSIVVGENTHTADGHLAPFTEVHQTFLVLTTFGQPRSDYIYARALYDHSHVTIKQRVVLVLLSAPFTEVLVAVGAALQCRQANTTKLTYRAVDCVIAKI